jgi:hypothetical protein
VVIESLYQNSASEVPKTFFKWSKVLGINKISYSDAFTSVRAYFTILCASVATNVNPSGENWKIHPTSQDVNRHYLQQNCFAFIAEANTSAGTKVTDGSSSSLLWKLITRCVRKRVFPRIRTNFDRTFLQL